MAGGGTSPSAATPLTHSEAESLLGPFAPYRRIALAVSGGADSMALMLLAAEWRRRGPDRPELTVLTVDHGLRAEAAAETAMVAREAARLGLAHRALPWTGPKPAADLQAAARAARYGLMTQQCRAEGIAAIATAHTADDQAETLLMRLARGSGLDGLAAMAPTSARDGVALLRPLLTVSRPRLIATLRERGLGWIEDPSNQDRRYERSRLRAGLKAAEALGLTPERLARAALRLGRARIALEQATRDLLRETLTAHPAGYGELPLAALTVAPQEIAVRALAAMAAIFGGGQRPVRLARVEALEAAIRQGSARQATLGGAIFARRGGLLRAAREFGRMTAAPMPLPEAGRHCWDGRFLLAAAEAGLTAEPLGPHGLRQLRAEGASLALPARIGWTLPALRRGGALVFVPLAQFEGTPPSHWLPGCEAVFVGAGRLDDHISGTGQRPSHEPSA
jgi:tRNA(Ile)-lysidine synthase